MELISIGIMRRNEKVMVALLLTFNVGHIERKLKTGH